MNSFFFIVTDRGNVRAYRAEKAPGDRPPHLRLVQALTLAEAHLRPIERFSDEEGAFPVTDAGGSHQGRHQNSIAERHIELEEDRRLVKQLAGHINAILRQEQPGHWSFAAPVEIHQAILDELEPAFRQQLVESVSRDLVKVSQSELLDHFSAVRAAP